MFHKNAQKFLCTTTKGPVRWARNIRKLVRKIHNIGIISTFSIWFVHQCNLSGNGGPLELPLHWFAATLALFLFPFQKFVTVTTKLDSRSAMRVVDQTHENRR